jgi:hypothetical protein
LIWIVLARPKTIFSENTQQNRMSSPKPSNPHKQDP